MISPLEGRRGKWRNLKMRKTKIKNNLLYFLLLLQIRGFLKFQSHLVAIYLSLYTYLIYVLTPQLCPSVKVLAFYRGDSGSIHIWCIFEVSAVMARGFL